MDLTDWRHRRPERVPIREIRLHEVGPHVETKLHPSRLNILFGQNGSGKSTVLDAVKSVLTMGDLVRVSRMSRSAHPNADVQVVLGPEESVGPSLLTRLLNVHFTGLPFLDTILGNGMPYGPDVDRLLDEIAFGQTGQQASDVRNFVTPLLSNLILTIHSDWQGGRLEVCGSAPRQVLIEIARQIEFGGMVHPLEEFGPARFDVGKFCWESRNNAGTDVIEIPLLVLGDIGSNERFKDSSRNENRDQLIISEASNSIPLALRLDDDLEDFEAYLESQISILMVVLGDDAARSTGDKPQSGEYFDEPGGDELGYDERSPDGWLIDDRAGVGDASRRFHEQKTTPDSAYFINPLVFRAKSLIESRANENLPSFISDQLTISLVVLPPGRWSSSSPRVRVYARGMSNVSIPLDLAGSGIRKWSLLATRLACAELKRGRVGDVGGNVTIEPDSSQVVLLIDEPEAHLHPNAVRSVAQWIDHQSMRCMHVLVATHHPIILNLRGEGIRHLLVSKTDQGSQILEWSPSDDGLTREVATSLGTTVADLFLLSSYILFVEGPHDELMLHGLFGPHLSDYGIRVIPMHGIKNVHTLAAEEVIWALGIPLGVMADNIRSGDKTAESKQLEKLRHESEKRHLRLDEWHLPKKDILRCIPDSVMRQSGNGRFPGWGSIDDSYAKYVTSCVRKSPDNEKTWMSREFGFNLLDRDFVKGMVTQMESEPPPTDLVNLVADLIKIARPLTTDMT